MQHQKLGGKSCVQLQLMALVNGGTQDLKADLLCTTYFVTLNSSSYTGPFFQVVPFLAFLFLQEHSITVPLMISQQVQMMLKK